MKLVLIGHACWLVETADVKILFDPLLYDPNQCDCCEVHPSRRIDPKHLCDVDVVVISHRHIDHFDVRSLCSLPKKADVLCPQDCLITKTLEAIGFSNVHVIGEWEYVRYGATTIGSTPSLNPVPEYGFVVTDTTNTIWNQIDTQVAVETAAKVNQLYGRLDILITPWQPLLELKFQFNESTAFPHQTYAELIRRARSCATKTLIPGASGFRYGIRSKWLNRTDFPVARDRFLEDMKGALPAGDTTFYKMDSGDEIICDQTGQTLCRQTCRFVSSGTSEDRLVAFCPVDPFQNLFKDNAAVSAADCGMSAVIDDLDCFVQREICDNSSKLSSYNKWKVLYQLIVCFDFGDLFVYWDFGRDAIRVNDRSTRANATSIISGRVLSAMARGACSWEEAYHSGGWRFFQSVAVVSSETYSLPNPDEIEDILRLRYPYAQALEMRISEELKRWGGR